MARSKSKPVLSSSRASTRPMWFRGLSRQDRNHVLSLVEMGMDSSRTSMLDAVSSHPSLSTPLSTDSSSPQTDSPLQTFHDKAQIIPSKVVAIDSVNTLLVSKGDPSIKPCRFRCYECHRKFMSSHQLLEHYWYLHIKHKMLLNLSKREQNVRRNLAKLLIYNFEIFEDFLDLDPVTDPTAGSHLSCVQILYEVFDHYCNIEAPPIYGDHYRTSGLGRMYDVIAPSADDTVP